MKLGKKPARPGAIKLRFGTYFDRRTLPVPPVKFGQTTADFEWGVLGNLSHACCVFSGAAHETMAFAFEGKRDRVWFTDGVVLGDYAAATGFDRNHLETDQGADLAEAASYRRKVGVLDAKGDRHKIFSYVGIAPGAIDDVAMAAFLTGACGVGLRLPVTAMDQFKARQPWEYVPGAAMAGGHYVPVIGRNSKGHFICVTWGRLHAMTPHFAQVYMDEGVCYVSEERLNDKNLSPQGFDLAGLTKAVAALAA